MELILPQFGLFFWTALIFTTLFLVLRKLAWKPILSALKDREEGIANALAAAEQARADVAKLQTEYEQQKRAANEERTKILSEAREAQARTIAEARSKADAEAQKLLENARQQIESEKNAALAEIKAVAGMMAIEVAEKLLRKQLENRSEQEALAKRLIDEISLN
jgi:F-type H+-transporting ATPase subunit b